MRFATVKARLRRTFPKAWPVAVYVWWRLRLSLPWSQTRFLKQALAIRAARRPVPGRTGHPQKILFFISRQDRDQLAMASVLAWALELRGHSPFLVGCDRALRRSCNYGFYPRLDPWVCRTCHLFAAKTHDATGLGAEWLGQLRCTESIERAWRLVDSLAAENYEDFVYRDFHLGRIVRHSVAHFLRRGAIGKDGDSRRIYADWLRSGVWLVDACQELMARHQPDVVFMLNGLFAPEWIMLQTARAAGRRVVAYEVGFRPETFFFQHNNVTDMCDNASWPRFRDQALTAEEDARLDRYLKLREGGGGYLLNYFPDLQASREVICREFGIDPSRKIAVLFPSITWDSTLFEKDIGFRGMGHWIEETIRIFAALPEAQLVIRVHPAEKVLPGADRESVLALIREKFPQLPSNVIVVPPTSGASSYVLMKLANCGLVYGSTTGLEMGVRGIPVVVAGQVYYGGLGFTLDGGQPEAYRRAIQAVLAGETAKDDVARTEAWRRYAYFAIFRSAIPLPQVEYVLAGELPRLRVHDLADLGPGRDPNLDVVCDGITEGTPFLTARMRGGE